MTPSQINLLIAKKHKKPKEKHTKDQQNTRKNSVNPQKPAKNPKKSIVKKYRFSLKSKNLKKVTDEFIALALAFATNEKE
jgi:hypothetical protein